MNEQEIEEQIDFLNQAIKNLEEPRDELKAQLIEAEKPKLRHGDYGYFRECLLPTPKYTLCY